MLCSKTFIITDLKIVIECCTIILASKIVQEEKNAAVTLKTIFIVLILCILYYNIKFIPKLF